MKAILIITTFLPLLLLSCGKKNAATDSQEVSQITPQDLKELKIEMEDNKVFITGKTISIDKGDIQGIRRRFHNNEEFDEVYFHCDKFILSTWINIPNTNVTIKAKVFESHRGAQLSLQPLPYENPAPIVNGFHGIHGSTLILDVEEANFHQIIDRPMFIVNGGNGQNAGEGEDGADGRSVPHDDGVIATYATIGGEPFLINGSKVNPGAGKSPLEGGRPGLPGNGGTIKTKVFLEPSLYRIEGGRAGNSAKTVYTGNPGSPNPYAIIVDGKREVFHMPRRRAVESKGPGGPRVGEKGKIIYLEE